MKVIHVKSQEAGVRRPYPHTDASMHLALFTVRTGPLQGLSVWVRCSGTWGRPCYTLLWLAVSANHYVLSEPPCLLQSQRMKWKCPMMVSEAGCLRDRLLGWRGWEGGSLTALTHSALCPTDEKEAEVDYRTVTVNTEQKVSDVYDIEERLGS